MSAPQSSDIRPAWGCYGPCVGGPFDGKPLMHGGDEFQTVTRPTFIKGDDVARSWVYRFDRMALIWTAEETTK